MRIRKFVEHLGCLVAATALAGCTPGQQLSPALTRGTPAAHVGAAVLLGGRIGAIVGWVTVVIGLGMVGAQLWLGDMLPAFVYMPTTLIGIALRGVAS